MHETESPAPKPTAQVLSENEKLRELLQEAEVLIDGMATWFRNQPLGAPPRGTAEWQAKARCALASGVQASSTDEAAYQHDRAYTDGMVFARQCIGAPTTMERADEALRKLDAVIQRRHAQEAEYRIERRTSGVQASVAPSYEGPKLFTPEEQAMGNKGIRWVTETYVAGRPTEHDVLAYLEARGADAKCGCEECRRRLAALGVQGEADLNYLRACERQNIALLEAIGYPHEKDTLTSPEEYAAELKRKADAYAPADPFTVSAALRRLIADDAYAMTFQTMGQYRTALLKAINNAESAAGVECSATDQGGKR